MYTHAPYNQSPGIVRLQGIGSHQKLQSRTGRVHKLHMVNRLDTDATICYIHVHGRCSKYGGAEDMPLDKHGHAHTLPNEHTAIDSPPLVYVSAGEQE